VDRVVGLTAEARGDAELPKILFVTSRTGNAKAECGETRTQSIEDGVTRNRREVRITLAPGASRGPQAATIAARYMHRGQEFETSLWLTWAVQSSFDVTPKRIFVGTLTSSEDERLERKVTVKRLDDQPFEIRRVLATDPAIGCYAKLNSLAKNHEIRIVIATGRGGSLLAGDVIVETDYSAEQTLTVPVTVLSKVP